MCKFLERNYYYSNSTRNGIGEMKRYPNGYYCTKIAEIDPYHCRCMFPDTSDDNCKVPKIIEEIRKKIPGISGDNYAVPKLISEVIMMNRARNN